MPLRDATAARQVSREMRDEVDEAWRAWGIRATAEDRRRSICDQVQRTSGCELNAVLDCGPAVVYAFGGSHAHHLASLGLGWLALLVAEAPDFNGMTWGARVLDQSPLMVAVQARKSVGRGAYGEVEWAFTLGDEEVARLVRVAVALGADVNRRLHGARLLMTYCAMRGCVEAVKACLAAGSEVEALGGDDDAERWTALVHAGRGGHEAVVGALLEAGASARVRSFGQEITFAAVCWGRPTLGIVRRLAEAGADVAAARDGRTAMHNAADGEVVRSAG